ncbi:MAG: hypothetical protein AAF657_21950, partial [Acidobacteriota bacterium]
QACRCTEILSAAALLLLANCSPNDPTREAMPSSSALAPSESVAPSQPPDFLLGGIQVNEADPDRWFDALEAQSMNTVQITDYAQQGDWDSDDLTWSEENAAAVAEMRGAQARGVSVVFICRVHLDEAIARNAFLWHGMIVPKTDELLAAWFEKYGRFVVRWAEIAEREGVDVFMIGSELNALATTLPATEIPTLEEYFLNDVKQADRRAQVLSQADSIDGRQPHEGFASVAEYIDARIATERAWAEIMTGGSIESVDALNARRAQLKAYWRALIAKVRQVYSGQVGYAANFDQYHEVGFWQDLDVMGINAYFPLRSHVLADESEAKLAPLLVDGWRRVLSEVTEVRRRQQLDQPVVFTEMGYTYRAKSTLNPWAHEGFALIPAETTRADGSPGALQDSAVVWAEQPERRVERAWAVRALWQAHGELAAPFLEGILYWKLSSHDYHLSEEAFMVHIGPGTDDPVLSELRRFLD